MKRVTYTGLSVRIRGILAILAFMALTVYAATDNWFYQFAFVLSGLMVITMFLSGIYLTPTHVIIVSYYGFRRIPHSEIEEVYLVKANAITRVGYYLDQVNFVLTDNDWPAKGSGSFVRPARSREVWERLRTELLESPNERIGAAVTPVPYHGGQTLIAGVGVLGGTRAHELNKWNWVRSSASAAVGQMDDTTMSEALEAVDDVLREPGLVSLPEGDLGPAFALTLPLDALAWETSYMSPRQGTSGLRIIAEHYPAFPQLAPIILIHAGLALSLARALGHDPTSGKPRASASTILRHDLPLAPASQALRDRGYVLALVRNRSWDSDRYSPTPHIQPWDSDEILVAETTRIVRIITPFMRQSGARFSTVSRQLRRRTTDTKLGLIGLTQILGFFPHVALAIVPLNNNDPAALLDFSAQLDTWRDHIHLPTTDLGMYRLIEDEEFDS